MATYAIGDVQGCFDELQALLEKIQFNPPQDKLWFVGDMVNRGKKSLETLRFIKGLGHSALSVLGNHDLHLLAVVYGGAPLKGGDTLDEVLAAPDCEELCQWLRYCPFLHYDPTLGYCISHAGIFPEWTLEVALECSRELEGALQSPSFPDYFANMYGNDPHYWDPAHIGWDRLRFITNVFTRMRLCNLENHRLNLKQKGPPGEAPQGFMPWFKVPNRANKEVNIIFGHWASLDGDTGDEPGVFALDTGCVWGRTLTAMRLEDRAKFTVPSNKSKS